MKSATREATGTASTPRGSRRLSWFAWAAAAGIAGAAVYAVAVGVPSWLNARETAALRRVLAADPGDPGEELRSARFAGIELSVPAAGLLGSPSEAARATPGGAPQYGRLVSPFGPGDTDILRRGCLAGPSSAAAWLADSDDYPAAAARALSAATMAVVCLREGTPEPKEPAEAGAGVYAALATADAVGEGEAGPWLAPQVVTVRRGALTVLRERRPGSPETSPLAARLDALLLDQNTALVHLQAEEMRDPAMPSLVELGTDRDPIIRARAQRRLRQERLDRRAAALAATGPAAEQLRDALLEAGEPDPRTSADALAEWLRAARISASWTVAPGALPEAAAVGEAHALPVMPAPQ